MTAMKPGRFSHNRGNPLIALGDCVGDLPSPNQVAFHPVIATLTGGAHATRNGGDGMFEFAARTALLEPTGRPFIKLLRMIKTL
jgi:hypothetical protein